MTLVLTIGLLCSAVSVAVVMSFFITKQKLHQELQQTHEELRRAHQERARTPTRRATDNEPL